MLELAARVDELHSHAYASYRAAFEQYKSQLANLHCSVKDLALFVYDAGVFSAHEGERASADFMLLKSVPLGNAA